MERATLEIGNVDALIERAKADAETYEGADHLEPEQGIDSPEIQTGTMSGAFQAPDRVLLVNIDFKEETMFLPDENGNFTGEKVKFQDGYLSTTREIADKVLAANPHIYEEIETGIDPFEAPDGFKTWNAQGYQRYLAAYYAAL